ncbi:MAG: potassium-transporting ATPase subunit F [Betaproteobacteria bacterium]|nr:potassium-transporting ATPase subunit F [Betaproteobacteria bacterium]
MYGCPVYRRERADVPCDRGHGHRLRQAGGAQVTWLYWLAGSASLGLVVYLAYALLRAEDF